ncbi:MAG TPA: endonuclease domain-containing protein [Chitinophagales bacterium]|nr:endonuclease domain-containing protein [Chitinophagales bacterium]
MARKENGFYIYSMRYHSKLPMYYGAGPKLFEHAKQMRYAPTVAEKKLWDILNAEPYLKHKFRRQHPIARYIADFYSHSLKLVIEVDGGVHTQVEQKEYDEFRDEDMVGFEIIVLRLTNDEVLNECDVAIKKIESYIARCNLGSQGGCSAVVPPLGG